MIRSTLAVLALAAGITTPALAQDTGTTRLRDAVSDQCQIDSIAYARSGVAIIGTCGEGGPMVLASDGGTRPGGVSAFTSWAIAAKAGQTSRRNTVTIRHREPGSATQAICAELAAPGPTRRQGAPCREIVSAID